MIADVEKETQSRMQQAVDHAREDLSTIRTGRAHPAMFNRLNADYYGAPTPLQQLATFNSPDPRTMLITPFDRSAIAAIEKVIREADLGVNPSKAMDVTTRKYVEAIDELLKNKEAELSEV